MRPRMDRTSHRRAQPRGPTSRWPRLSLCLVALLRPDRGRVLVGDDNISILRGQALYDVRKRFGVLFQDGALFGSMTVYDNTAFPLREHTRKPEAEIRHIVMEKLDLVGLRGAELKFHGEI